MATATRQIDSVEHSGETAGDRGYLQGSTVRNIGIVAALMLAAYLVGYIPASLAANGYETRLNDIKRESRLTSIRTSLAAAALNADRGEYEDARQETSEFFTKLRAELDRDDSVIANGDRDKARDILSQRDDVITHLARGDAAAGKVLTDWYFEFKSLK